MRGVPRLGHSVRERHPNGEGPPGVVAGGTHQALELGTGAQLEPPPGAPIRTAWIAGRIGLAFVDEGALDPTTIAHGSLESLEALDVELRPYIWDL